MFCTKCGKEIENDSCFCCYCGTPVLPAEPIIQVPTIEAQTQSGTQLSIQSQMPLTVEPVMSQCESEGQAALPFPKKSVKKPVIIASVVVTIMGIIVFTIIAFVKPRAKEAYSYVTPSRQEETTYTENAAINKPTTTELTEILSKLKLTFNSTGLSISVGEAVNHCIKDYEISFITLDENEHEKVIGFNESLIDNYKKNFNLDNVYLAIVAGDVILAMDVPYYTEYQKTAVFCILPFDENGNHIQEWDSVNTSTEFASSVQQYMYSQMF